MTLPFPIPSKADVAALDAAVALADTAVAAAASALDEAKGRAAAIEQRIAAHATQQPPGDDAFDDAALDAMAADPSADFDTEAMIAGVRERLEAHRLWHAQDRMLARTLAKIGEEIDARASDLSDVKAAREQVWVNFVTDAHNLLVGEFCDAIERLKVNILDPMAALAAERRQNGTNVLAASAAQIEALSNLTVGYYRETEGTSIEYETDDTAWDAYYAEVARRREEGGDPDAVPRPDYKMVTRPTVQRSPASFQLFPRPRGQAPVGSIDAFRASLAAIQTKRSK